MGRINSEQELQELRKNPDKTKRRNAYKVGDLMINQFYDASTDYLNPFKAYVYKDGSYLMGGSGATIEDSYNNLILQSLKYMEQYKQERNDLITKIDKVNAILNPDKDDEIDDRFSY